MKSVGDNKSRIVVVETKAGKKNSLNEVLHDDTVMNLIKDTRAVMEIRAFMEFVDLLSSHSDRACYGTKSVEAAHELLAIETLWITDDLFRNAEIATRKKYIGLVNAVKNAGGNTFVLSPNHVSGEELAKLTGIAATLRFPVPGLDDMEI
ncbi:protein PELOTA 1 [Ziziphus jujuba]|uniref:Protein PELOTA 1 n=2 Tax=Ziziphus jujuba TaxID=326968 RepID=A0A6P6FLM7_ZIZJJ|nr:protein PELOTA 1 [Ziziphus jujuba]